jgi:hypothetical protein
MEQRDQLAQGGESGADAGTSRKQAGGLESRRMRQNRE